jgi:hypothetical protein
MAAQGRKSLSSLAQQLGCGCGRIVVGLCVTPRDPRKAILNSPPFDQPMNKESLVAQN